MKTPPKRPTDDQSEPEVDWLASDTLIVPPPSFRERLQAAQRARDTQQTGAAPAPKPPDPEDEATADVSGLSNTKCDNRLRCSFDC